MLVTILHTHNFIKIHQFVLKILNGNKNLTSIKAASAADEIHFLGDFKINLLSDEAFDFSEMIKEPTRVTADSATFIDHVYTNQPDKITECFVQKKKKNALSDHYPVCFTRHTSKLQTKKRNHNSIKYRSFTIFENSAFLEILNTEIAKLKCTQSDSNMNFSTWNALFLSVLNKHAPLKKNALSGPRNPHG